MTEKAPVPRNRGFLPNGYVEGDQPWVEILPHFTDAEVLEEWEGTLSIDVPEHPVIEREVFHRYSAAQCRDIGQEVGSWWGVDGELKTWVMVATVRHGESR